MNGSMPSPYRLLGSTAQADRIIFDSIDHCNVDVMLHAAGCQLEASPSYPEDRANVLAVRTLYFHALEGLGIWRTPRLICCLTLRGHSSAVPLAP